MEYGATWTLVRTLNRSADATITLPNGRTMDGNWHYEASTLVHDPTDTGKEWKLFAHRVFWSYKKDALMPSYGWINYRHASRPDGEWSEELPLFGAGDFPPPPYDKTLVKLNDLHPDLKDSVAYSEMGTIVHGGALYMSVASLRLWGSDKIVLLRSNDHARTWSYAGTLVTREDARAFGFKVFDGSSLARDKGRLFLLAMIGHGFIKHRGTFVMEFDDITLAKLKRDASGRLLPAKYIRPNDALGERVGAGQSDYDERNTAGGVLMPQFNLKGYPQLFQVFSTHASLAD